MGTRLRPLSYTGPKQLLPIANKPNIVYCVEDLRDAGAKQIAVILGNNNPEKVRELLGDGSRYGVSISYVVQGDPKGIAHAVLCAKEFVGADPFVVYLGDNLLKGGIRGMVGEFERGGADAAIALCKVGNPSAFGVAVLDERGEVVRCVEKPASFVSDLAVIGIYMFRPGVFRVIEELKPSARGELEITDTITGVITSGGRVRSWKVEGWWKDTGKPQDLLEANHLVLDDLAANIEGTVEEGAQVTGRVALGPGSVIEKGCRVRGPVLVGANCHIGPNAYVGPYTSIGDGSVIADCEVEASMILEHVTVRCRRKIVDSIIGPHSQVLSSEGLAPEGVRVVLGDYTTVRV
ncbi:MAG TPA: glucose-1-phosphate thymidylyltransferase [Candidatus Thermoplasmatota archaeon]